MNSFGVYTALVLLLKDGSIDYAKLEKLIEEQISSGVDGIVLNGTTGQAFTLSWEEQFEFAKWATQLINKRVDVVYGATSNSTKESVNYCKKLVDFFGVDTKVLCATGYYNKPGDIGKFEHYSAIAETGCKVILYHVPSRGSNLSIELVNKLMENENIVGIKDADEDNYKERGSKIIENAKNNSIDFAYISGEDSIFAQVLSLGGVGIISATANICPKFFVDIYKGDEKEEVQVELNKIVDFVFSATNPIPLLRIFDSEASLPLSLKDMKDSDFQDFSKHIQNNKDKLGIDLDLILK